MLSVCLTPDGQWVMSGSKDRGVQFWDPVTGNAQMMLQGHKNSGECHDLIYHDLVTNAVSPRTVISVAPAPIGSLFATGSGDMRARIWRSVVMCPWEPPTLTATQILELLGTVKGALRTSGVNLDSLISPFLFIYFRLLARILSRVGIPETCYLSDFIPSAAYSPPSQSHSTVMIQISQIPISIVSVGRGKNHDQTKKKKKSPSIIT